MIEPPQTELYKKEFVEYMFESHNCAGLLLKNSASLSSFLHSKESAIVIDLGGYNTYISAVSEGDVLAEGEFNSFHSSQIRRRNSDRCFLVTCTPQQTSRV